jgi:hypothetical protein
MRNHSRMFSLTVISAALLCLALSGCGTKPEQSSNTPEQPTKQDQQQPAGTQPGTASPSRGDSAAAPDTAKSSTETTREVPPPPPAPPPPRTATLAVGTPILVVTSSTLSTKTNKTGESFQASLAQDIADGEWIVAKKGAAVTGVVSESDPGGKVKGVASITLQLKRLTLADGREISIATSSHSATAKSTKKKDAAKVGIGAGVGAAIGAIAGGGKGAAIGAGVGGAAGTGAVLATRGDPATIPSEARLTFKLAAPLEVTEKK